MHILTVYTPKVIWIRLREAEISWSLDNSHLAAFHANTADAHPLPDVLSAAQILSQQYLLPVLLQYRKLQSAQIVAMEITLETPESRRKSVPMGKCKIQLSAKTDQTCRQGEGTKTPKVPMFYSFLFIYLFLYGVKVQTILVHQGVLI